MRLRSYSLRFYYLRETFTLILKQRSAVPCMPLESRCTRKIRRKIGQLNSFCIFLILKSHLSPQVLAVIVLKTPYPVALLRV